LRGAVKIYEDNVLVNSHFHCGKFVAKRADETGISRLFEDHCHAGIQTKTTSSVECVK
jgi:hypothetical protein